MLNRTNIVLLKCVQTYHWNNTIYKQTYIKGQMT